MVFDGLPDVFHPLNIYPLRVMFVVLFDDVDEFQVGKDNVEPGVHVVLDGFIVPLPLFALNVIVTKSPTHEEAPPVLRSLGWLVPG